MAGLDLTSLVLAGAGALVLAKAMEGNGSEPFGQMPGNTTQSAAGNTVLDQIAAAGVTVQPTDQVQQITTTTPAGQTVSFATVNYNPWAPAANQTVYLNPLDPIRLQGRYIPQFPAWVKDAFGGEQRAFDYFKLYSQRIDVTGAPTESIYNFQMPLRDWDSLRLWDSREQPITAEEAAAAGYSLDDMMTLNGYHGALQRTGGWVRGVEIHKGPRANFNGLGAVRRYYGKWY